jgi:hypothetical protein
MDSYSSTKIVDNGYKNPEDRELVKSETEEPQGQNTITTGSFLVCRHGGLIEPVNSGQIHGQEVMLVPRYRELTEEQKRQEIIDAIDTLTLGSSPTLQATDKAQKEQRLTEKKMTIAKLLLKSMLEDEVFKNFDAAWMCGVVANAMVEGGPGVLENPNLDSNYMNCANTHGYHKTWTEIKNESHSTDPFMMQISSTKFFPKLNEILKHTSSKEGERCGFGMGMFQWTFERTANLMRIYNQMYPEDEKALDLEECFAADWTYFKDEMTGKDEAYDFSKLLKFDTSGDATDAAQEMAYEFRQKFEGSNNGIDVAKEFAKALLTELERVGAVDEEGQWKMD